MANQPQPYPQPPPARPPQPPMTSFDQFNEKIKASITLKLVAIGILVLVLLIPTTMIESLISERESRHSSAINEVSSKWGNDQTIAGPVLTIPYKKFIKGKDKEIITTIEYAHFLPDEINITGKIFPETRYRGIYKVVVYNAKLQFSGKFHYPEFTDWNIEPQNILWNEAFVSFGIPDMRGIKDSILLQWANNPQPIPFNPGIPIKDLAGSGVSVRVPLNKEVPLTYAFDLNLNGSKTLNFIPLGKETNIKLDSNWANPSFDGAFLPDKREVTKDGFNATWKILQLNRNYPQQWRGAEYDVSQSQFGVTLLLPVDEYQKSMRSAKYAEMIISLTFLALFFVEIIVKRRIHPFQYILVGLALCVFYTLLLSFSEHIQFNSAYIVAGIATIAAVTLYSKAIFRHGIATAIMGLIMVILYAFIFVVIQLQDYALLLGSIGLFIVLAILMFLSRKINWYSQ
jgi:inner membrane protein